MNAKKFAALLLAALLVLSLAACGTKARGSRRRMTESGEISSRTKRQARDLHKELHGPGERNFCRKTPTYGKRSIMAADKSA